MNILDYVCLRDKEHGDDNFIFDSWFKSYRHKNNIDSEIYYRGQRKVIEDTIAVLNVKVAYHADDPDHILGYVVYEYEEPKTAILHWLFVKKNFRRNGIANKLLEDVLSGINSIQHTHESFVLKRLSKLQGSKHNPYMIVGVRI